MVVLISSDGTRFRGDKRVISTYSNVFKDLAVRPKESVKHEHVVHLPEESRVVEQLLRYCTSAPSIAPIHVEDSWRFWELIAVFHKYELGRGLDAAGSAFKLDMSEHPGQAAPVVRSYLFAYKFTSGRETQAAVKRMLNFDADGNMQAVRAALRNCSDYGVDDGGKFLALLAKRRVELQTMRDELWESKIQRLEGLQGANPLPVTELLELWEQSAACKTPQALDEFLIKARGKKHFHLLPWDDLRDAMEDLTVSL